MNYTSCHDVKVRLDLRCMVRVQVRWGFGCCLYETSDMVPYKRSLYRPHCRCSFMSICSTNYCFAYTVDVFIHPILMPLTYFIKNKSKLVLSIRVYTFLIITDKVAWRYTIKSLRKWIVWLILSMFIYTIPIFKDINTDLVVN